NDKAAVAPLQKLARASKRPEARLHALCALDVLAGLRPDLVRRGLRDPSPGVRRHAVRPAGRGLGKDAAVAGRVVKRAEDDAQVRMQLAYSLGGWHSPRAARALAALALKDHADVYLRSAVLSSVGAENVAAVLGGVLAGRPGPAA